MNVKNAVPQRFILLDGLRMLAALGVLSFHVVVITDYTQIDNLYVLVDFFFALSGFVLLPYRWGCTSTVNGTPSFRSTPHSQTQIAQPI
jgi:peptidoglycan/LPS O-acetylase OafA/YrhL